MGDVIKEFFTFILTNVGVAIACSLLALPVWCAANFYVPVQYMFCWMALTGLVATIRATVICCK